MAEDFEQRVLVRKAKRYHIDAASLQGVPMYHSDHVMFSVGPTGVGMTFSIRLDTILDDGEKEQGAALPQACCFMSVSRAERFAKALTEYIEEYKEAKQKIAETKETQGELDKANAE